MRPSCNLLPKNFEIGERIFDVEEKGIDIGFGTVGFPNDPMMIHLFGVVLINAGSDLRLDKAEIRLEFKSVRSGHKHHSSFCENM